jgi:hypothetical protein
MTGQKKVLTNSKISQLSKEELSRTHFNLPEEKSLEPDPWTGKQKSDKGNSSKLG